MERNLEQKGFRRDKLHHVYFRHVYEGRETGAYTYISHTKKIHTISGDLLTSIRRQLQLDRNKDAYDLLTCPMDAQTYNQILIDKGVFKP